MAGVENLKEAGAFGPRLLEDLSPPRQGALASIHYLAGGGPPLRYRLLREGRSGASSDRLDQADHCGRLQIQMSELAGQRKSTALRKAMLSLLRRPLAPGGLYPPSEAGRARRNLSEIAGIRR